MSFSFRLIALCHAFDQTMPPLRQGVRVSAPMRRLDEILKADGAVETHANIADFLHGHLLQRAGTLWGICHNRNDFRTASDYQRFVERRYYLLDFLTKIAPVFMPEIARANLETCSYPICLALVRKICEMYPQDTEAAARCVAMIMAVTDAVELDSDLANIQDTDILVSENNIYEANRLSSPAGFLLVNPIQSSGESRFLISIDDQRGLKPAMGNEELVIFARRPLDLRRDNPVFDINALLSNLPR